MTSKNRTESEGIFRGRKLVTDRVILNIKINSVGKSVSHFGKEYDNKNGESEEELCDTLKKKTIQVSFGCKKCIHISLENCTK